MRGIITTYALIFGGIFLLFLSGSLGFILLQLKQANQKVAWAESLQVAEAGINYYRWCLNNGVEANCALEKDYSDKDGNVIGHFSLQVGSRESCGQAISKTITAAGWTTKYPQAERKIQVIYARPSVAALSYVLNDNVWVGADHEIRGPYQSNGGIRMDGENQSLVSSSKENWICTSSFGCSVCPAGSGCQVQGSNCVCPGVFTTANGDPNLFNFPVPPFDFNGLTIDLAQMKLSAQTSGVYLPPSQTINPSAKGYHLKFQNNGQINVWIITNLSSTYAYSLEEGWHYDYFTISSEYLYNTYSVPSACSAVFVEDNIWADGQVKGKVTVASANLADVGVDTDVILPDSIEYTTLDGSDGLTLLGERNILIGPQSPSTMEIRGIFIAQKGRFSRNHYPNNIRESLEISGSIVSSGRVGTQWTSSGQIVSGYRRRESYFDSNLIYAPPPFVPSTESEFKVINWEEVE